MYYKYPVLMRYKKQISPETDPNTKHERRAYVNVT